MKPTPGVEPSTSNLLGLMVSTLAGPGVDSITLLTNRNQYSPHTVFIIFVCLDLLSLCKLAKSRNYYLLMKFSSF